MRVTFLGTGTSHGIPQIACDCAVCQSPDPRNQRSRASVLIEERGCSVLVDATPDFRTQALRVGLQRLDAVLLTHAHADHFLGLDDLRVFTQNGPLPVYGSADTLADVRRVFPYACVATPAWATLPHLQLQPVTVNEPFEVGGLRCRAVEVLHNRLPVYGFIVNNVFGYVTDCSVVPAAVAAALHGVTVLVIDALRHRPHPSHLTVAGALEIIEQVQPARAYLTHICHELDHAVTEAALPGHVRLAYDGLRLELDEGRCGVI